MNDHEMNEFNDKLKRIVYNLVKNMDDLTQFEYLYDWDFTKKEVAELGFEELAKHYEKE